MKLFRFSICIAVLALFSSCVSNSPGPVGTSTHDWLVANLRIGESSSAVAKVMGSPERTDSRITANGRAELWQYSMGALITRHEGSMASFKYGMALQINNARERWITLTFYDGNLTAIEGL